MALNKTLLIISIVFMSVSTINAQDDLDGLLEAGLEDANKLAEGYVEPFMNAFGSGMANGWYNTAKAHKTAGFDLTFTASMAFVPDEDLFYDVASLNLQSITLSDSNYPDGRVPTMFGPALAPRYIENSSSEVLEGPEGLNIKEEVGFQAVPVPMAQLGIGIIKNTDLKIRWTPKIDISDDSEFKLIGFGVMHDVKQHIPGMKNLPFELAGFVGFTKMTLDAAFDDDQTSSSNGEVTTDNGVGVFEVKSFTLQALISKKMSVLTVYGALGFNNVKTRLALEGDYEVRDNSGFIENQFTNPINLNFATGGPRLTAGFMLKLAILTLHADYTLQKYSTLTAGIGFTVR